MLGPIKLLLVKVVVKHNSNSNSSVARIHNQVHNKFDRPKIQMKQEDVKQRLQHNNNSRNKSAMKVSEYLDDQETLDRDIKTNMIRKF